MTEAIFWELIDAGKKEFPGNFHRQTSLLVDLLLDFSVDDIGLFNHFLLDKSDELATAEIFAAFYIVFHEEPSSLFYFNFRVWLIGQGSETFRQIGKNPGIIDRLVGKSDKAMIMDQSLSDVARIAAWIKTRKKDPDLLDPNRNPRDVSIPITENEILNNYRPEFPRLMETFWPEEL